MFHEDPARSSFFPCSPAENLPGNNSGVYSRASPTCATESGYESPRYDPHECGYESPPYDACYATPRYDPTEGGYAPTEASYEAPAEDRNCGSAEPIGSAEPMNLDARSRKRTFTGESDRPRTRHQTTFGISGIAPPQTSFHQTSRAVYSERRRAAESARPRTRQRTSLTEASAEPGSPTGQPGFLWGCKTRTWGAMEQR